MLQGVEGGVLLARVPITVHEHVGDRQIRR
jgi:hypothetical protein